MSQNGGQTQSAPVPTVIPTVTNVRTSSGTPFITNIAKEVRREEQPKPAPTLPSTQPILTSQPEKPFKSKGFQKGPRVPPQGIPIQTSRSLKVPQPEALKPTFKLEMFEPQQPYRPFGVYDQYVPEIDFDKRKKFSSSAFQHLFLPTEALTFGPNLRMPIQQVYNINLPGPTGAHVEMRKIYENVLPKRDGQFTDTTLGERLQMYDYIRQILIKNEDGEDISIDSDSHHNLMSYIKFMELNPNYYSPIYVNPYQGLSYGLLVYRSCFPIRLNEQNQTTICAKNSTGLNIRLYALTYAEYYSYKFRQLVYKEYDVWRELAYYEYVRENIIKKKRSPNFPIIYAFFLCVNKTIDFFSLKKNCLTQKDFLTREYKKFVEVHTLFSKVKPQYEIIRPITLPDAARKVIAKLPDEMDPVLQLYSGTTLIIVTEAPHHNLYQWASRIYEHRGIARRMISHGYHDEKVWLDVLFQIVSALYIMQLHGIYMRNMTIQDNVYVKDLQTYGRAAGYWRYVIDGISYYVPNYGYVVFIDSNFKDIVPLGRTIERCQREYKIYTHDIIGKKYPMKSIKERVFDNYRSIINTNAFTKEHTKNNVTKPPESIMKLLENMMNDPEMDLGKVIAKHFRMLMNNRIGTLLRKDTEVPNIRDIVPQFKSGEMAIEVLEENLYKWCMILEVKNDGFVEILTKNVDKPNDFLSNTVRIETLKQYSPSEKIDQNINPDVNLSEDELLETYFITEIAT